MKTLEIIVCLLAIIVIGHAYNSYRAIQFKKYLDECSEELKETLTLPILSAGMFVCALQKDGQVFDDESVIKLGAMHKFMTDVIPNVSNIESSWIEFNICNKRADSLEYPYNIRILYIFTCIGPIVSTFKLDVD
ncbi:uncharacterized protein LOC116853075 isoform X2 [Odontomachus brunneus]|uniref:uncharacterized protein LOC116853075 isoform X2 n=1 Tax=Odontomachus brunneus TaxID=486640 RepID=UPI0013F21B94|nr:uncharacterized protein LOC116853075 isoform X2 [Odontomachus brunneus]